MKQAIKIFLPEDLLKKIDEKSKSRSSFIQKVLEEKFSGLLTVEGMSKTEKREVLKESKSIDDFLKEAMISRLERDRSFLDDLPNDEFAKLVSSRLPKESSGDADLEQDVLSLRKCLSMMPSVEDVTKELNRVKGLLYKAECERDLQKALYVKSEGRSGMKELVHTLYNRVSEYIVDCTVRNSLPGLGDGGGLSKEGYEQIGKQVEKELKELGISDK